MSKCLSGPSSWPVLSRLYQYKVKTDKAFSILLISISSSESYIDMCISWAGQASLTVYH